MENEGKDDQRKDGKRKKRGKSRKSVAPSGCKLHGIEAKGRACGDHQCVVTIKVVDDDDESEKTKEDQEIKIIIPQI